MEQKKRSKRRSFSWGKETYTVVPLFPSRPSACICCHSILKATLKKCYQYPYGCKNRGFKTLNNKTFKVTQQEDHWLHLNLFLQHHPLAFLGRWENHTRRSSGTTAFSVSSGLARRQAWIFSTPLPSLDHLFPLFARHRGTQAISQS